MSLPELSLHPRHHPDSCTSLSLHLLRTLRDLLAPSTSITLSIGSGTGLLEALLLHHFPSLDIAGVEVSATVNKYLSEPKLHVVNHTSALCPAAEGASALLFVYPRDGKLIENYVREYGGRSMQSVLLIIPQADYDDIVKGLGALITGVWLEEVVSDPGLAGWEILIRLHREGMSKVRLQCR